MAEEISAAVSKLTGEAQTNGQVYVSAVKKAAAKVSRVSVITLVCAWFRCDYMTSHLCAVCAWLTALHAVQHAQQYLQTKPAFQALH